MILFRRIRTLAGYGIAVAGVVYALWVNPDDGRTGFIVALLGSGIVDFSELRSMLAHRLNGRASK